MQTCIHLCENGSADDAAGNAGIVVSVAALDVSLSPQPPQEFLWEYPPALVPRLFFQIVGIRLLDEFSNHQIMFKGNFFCNGTSHFGSRSHFLN